MINVRVCLSLQTAQDEAQKLDNVVAVETEYGDEYFGKKDGAVLELLHHGTFESNKPACISLLPDEPTSEILYYYSNFIISHIDLDVIFGIMWAGGYLKDTLPAREISKIIAIVDEKGFFYFKNNIFNVENIFHLKYLKISNILNMWTFSKDDISKDIHKIILRIRDCIIQPLTIEEKQELLDKKPDERFLDKMYVKELTIPTFLVTYVGGVSVSNKYIYKGVEHQFILQYNSGSNSITLSAQTEEISKKFFGESGVIKPLQEFFGKGAGGHVSIGGTDRDQIIQFEMLEAFLKFLKRNYFNI